MKLFNKDKGFVLSCLNAVLLIWIIAAIVLTISNIIHILVKDISYTCSEENTVSNVQCGSCCNFR